jgi:hypothetical protein
MGVDWDAYVAIYSEHSGDLLKILQNFPKYFPENITNEDNEGRVHLSKRCITIQYSIHTCGLSTDRNGIIGLNNLYDILYDFPSSFIEGHYWADSGTIKLFVGWNQDGSCARTKVLSYETVDDQFYPHYQRAGRDIVPHSKPKQKDYKYENSLCFESHTSFTQDTIDTLLDSLQMKEITYYKGCSNWVDVHFTSDTQVFNGLYKLLEDFEDCYVRLDWHRLDGTETGLWAGNNSQGDITAQSIRYPTNPNLYTLWNKGKKILLNEHIAKLYKQ